jgi:hypothetical protein
MAREQNSIRRRTGGFDNPEVSTKKIETRDGFNGEKYFGIMGMIIIIYLN